MRANLMRARLGTNGGTAIEYAMIAFFVSIASFAAITTIGNDVSALFARIAAGF